MTEEQLSALLRLKRFEQPPPGYFDQLLRDVQRRQRADLIRSPLWKLALERMQTFFGEHSMSPARYAGAMATIAILGIGAIRLAFPNGMNPAQQKTGGELARNEPAPTVVPAPNRILNLQPPLTSGDRVMANWEDPRPTVQPGQPTHSRRYIIDARPVSYEPSFSF
jgi:hypothetical protein